MPPKRETPDFDADVNGFSERCQKGATFTFTHLLVASSLGDEATIV
jgi:hypothetical protein